MSARLEASTDLFSEEFAAEARDRVLARCALNPTLRFEFRTAHPERMRAYFADPASWGRVVTAMEQMAAEQGWHGVYVMPELAVALVTGFPLPNVKFVEIER